MKKLIFLLFPVYSFGQLTIGTTSNPSFINNTVATISSATYNAGTKYVFFIYTTASGVNPTDNPTISAGGMSFVKIGTATGTNERIITYTLDPASNTTTTITFTYAETQLLFSFAIYTSSTFLGNTINIASNATTGANPSLTIGVTSNAYTAAFFINNANPFGGTPESGWTEDADNGSGGPVGIYCVHRNSTTDNTIVVTAASSNWIGAAIQFSGRRATVIN